LLDAAGLLGFLALCKLLLHLLTNGNYGYFRDDLYYMAAGEPERAAEPRPDERVVNCMSACCYCSGARPSCCITLKLS